MRTDQRPDPAPRLLSREQVEAAADTLRRADRLYPGDAETRTDLLMWRDCLDWVMGRPSLFGEMLLATEGELRDRKRRRRRGR